MASRRREKVTQCQEKRPLTVFVPLLSGTYDIDTDLTSTGSGIIVNANNVTIIVLAAPVFAVHDHDEQE